MTEHTSKQCLLNTPHKMSMNSSTDHSQSPSSKYSHDSSEVKPRLMQRSGLPEKSRINKTTLCKYYETNGFCKFREKCSFAHGKHELHDRHSNQMQMLRRPCKRYFGGVCPYGEKCQYLHSCTIDLVEMRDFVEKTFRERKLMVPLHPEKMDQNERFDVQRFHHLYKIFGKKLNFKRDDLYINSCRKRLPLFENLGQWQAFERQEVEEFLSKSRKVSEQN